MSSKKPNYNHVKNNFLESLLSMDREQISNFVAQKGREPKLIKPIICLKDLNQKESITPLYLSRRK